MLWRLGVGPRGGGTTGGAVHHKRKKNVKLRLSFANDGSSPLQVENIWCKKLPLVCGPKKQRVDKNTEM